MLLMGRGFFMTSARDILILGASTRAAAFSALRAGLRPHCIDFFADRDLSSACAVIRIDPEEGASGLERAASSLPGADWLYTGPLENHPELVERLSLIHQLCGNSRATLQAVRDPLRVADVLSRAGLPHPDVRLSDNGLPRERTWLVKPVASGGGRLIRFFDEQPSFLAEPCYYQEWVDGPSFSAIFLADAARAEFIGVTRQLIGAEGLPFAYQGSIGPWPVSDRLRNVLEQLGSVLTTAFNLVGLFGFDYILRDDGPWPVEVNPRYTASVEVLELALRRSLIAEHLHMCAPELVRSGIRSELRPGNADAKVVGKGVLYSRRASVIPKIAIDESWQRDPLAVPEIADVPWPARVDAGQPLLTVFETGPDTTICASRLARKQEHWRRRLGQ
jgi:predicted ATP-grasp superfamily ATP-dependent carboligase